MKKMILILCLFISNIAFAQDDLLEMLDSTNKTNNEISATFKASRIITMQSIESMKAGELNFRISHRFGRLNSGIEELFGMDQSNIYFGLEYGITNDFEIGIGRTPLEKTLNGYAKYKVLKQSDNCWLSLSYFSGIDMKTNKFQYTGTDYIADRMTFTQQLLIAHKFNEDFSLQLLPTFIHNNMVESALDQNNIAAIGIGGRYKFTQRFSLNFEYAYVVRPSNTETTYKDPLSISFDLETGGHVFQIMLSNSPGMIERHYIAENTGDWLKGDIHIGFNITRPFSLFN